MPRNLKLVLSYNGAPYSGWQVQPDRPTVQGALSAAIGRITGEKVTPQGSGRTDAGVHALAQVATFTTESTIPPENMVKALNSALPDSIRVLKVEETRSGFHARHHAKTKSYRYRIYRGAILPPFLVDYVCHHPFPLDEAAMMEAAKFVVGEHDFTSFAAVDPDRTQLAAQDNGENGVNKVRTISSSTWSRDGEELVYNVRGNGFLHHMVRNLVGTFLLVGKGTLVPRDICKILETRNRSAAGATAPASGLYLVNVEY